MDLCRFVYIPNRPKLLHLTAPHAIPAIQTFITGAASNRYMSTNITRWGIALHTFQVFTR